MVIEELKEENKKEKPVKTKPKVVKSEEKKEEDTSVLPYEKDGDVIILTDDNFEEVVMSN